MWELDHEEGLVPKNWCFWTVVLEKTLESPLDCKEIKVVSPKWNWPWIFIGRTDAEAEAPILWPPDANIQLIGEDLDSGKDQGQEEKRTREDEMVGWHHWLSGYEFEPILRDGEWQGSLASCSPWGCKESDTTERPKRQQQHPLSWGCMLPRLWWLWDENRFECPLENPAAWCSVYLGPRGQDYSSLFPASKILLQNPLSFLWSCCLLMGAGKEHS